MQTEHAARQAFGRAQALPDFSETKGREAIMKKEIEAVLEQRVRPMLRSHGGDIEALSLENGVLRVRLLGHCSNCPSAVYTTEQLVQQEVCDAVPQVQHVLLEQDVSDDLWMQAKALLRHG